MNKNDIFLAKKTLNLLKSKNWQEIKLEDYKSSSKKKLKKSKNDLLKNINFYIDFLLKKEIVALEESSTKDMLFEVMMTRFDIIQKYRKSFLSLFNSFKFKPQKIIILLAPFLESMILMASLADIRIKGLNGQLIIKGIFIIYIATFYVWLNDDSESLEKTMTALDNYLEKAIKLWNYKY